jgi:Protein of unknown function (DUF559)
LLGQTARPFPGWRPVYAETRTSCAARARGARRFLPGAIRCRETSAGARHSSCARGASSGRQPGKGAIRVQERNHSRRVCSQPSPRPHGFGGSAVVRPSLKRAGHAVQASSPAARVHRGLPRAVPTDGGYHAGRKHADARRDHKLQRAGYRVLRIQAELVMRDLPGAVAQVVAALRSQDP